MLNKNTVDFAKNISPVDFAHQMLESTAENGTLYLNDWYDVDCEDCMTYNNFVAKIKWSENGLEDIISEFNEIVNDIKVIADFINESDTTLENLPELLVDDSLISTYFIYLAPLNAINQQTLNADVVGRISEGLCGYEIIRHSQRLCKLYSLNAPEIVVQKEERMLLASLIIHAFGKEIKKVSWLVK